MTSVVCKCGECHTGSRRDERVISGDSVHGRIGQAEGTDGRSIRLTGPGSRSGFGVRGRGRPGGQQPVAARARSIRALDVGGCACTRTVRAEEELRWRPV